MRIYALLLLFFAALSWLVWQAYYVQPTWPPYVGGIDRDSFGMGGVIGNMVPYIGDTDICEEKSGRVIYRTVDSVSGFADRTTERGCDISNCRIRLLRDGYSFIEAYLSEKQAERLRRQVRLEDRRDLEYSAIATDAGWYRFELAKQDAPGTENHSLHIKQACEFRNRTQETVDCDVPSVDQYYVAMQPIPAPSARYQLRKSTGNEIIIPRKFRLTDYSVRVIPDALEIWDTETNEALAVDQKVTISFVNPRLNTMNYVACNHSNRHLRYDVTDILIPVQQGSN